MSYEPGVVDPSGTGYALFTDSLLSTGWGVLDVKVGYGDDSDLDDMDKMFAAGFLEGALTYK